MDSLGSQSLTIVVQESHIMLKKEVVVKEGQDIEIYREGSIRRTVRAISKSQRKKQSKFLSRKPGVPRQKEAGGCFVIFGNLFSRSKKRNK